MIAATQMAPVDVAASAAPVGISDEQLMRRYVERADEAAFAALFSRYAHRLRGFFVRAVGHAGLADDMTQATLLNVHRARRDFDLDRPFRPWLFTIALNVRREHFRRVGRRRETPYDPADEVGPAVEPRVTSARDRLVRRAIAALREDQREVVVLHWYEEFTFAEIGAMLAISPGAARLRAHRAYNALRAALGEGGAPS